MREHRNLIAMAAIPAAAALLLSGCSSAPAETEPSAAAGVDDELHELLPESIKDSGVISFGALWETPPMIGVDPADPNTPVGFAPDLAGELGNLLGVDVEWQNLQWPAQLPGVQSGSVDVLFGQVSITEERETSIVDLITFQSEPYAVLFRTEDEGQFSSLAELCGWAVAVPVGSTQAAYIGAASERCVEEGEDAIAMTEYQGATAAIQAMRAGTVDAWMNSESSQIAVVDSNPDVFDLFTVSEEEIPPSRSGIAVGKSQPELTLALTEALGVAMDNGTYQELMDEWGMTGAITRDELAVNPITGTPAGETVE